MASELFVSMGHLSLISKDWLIRMHRKTFRRKGECFCGPYVFCGSLSYYFLKSVLFNENNLTKNLSQNLRPIKNSLMRKQQQLNLQKTKIMASGPITSWQIAGETVEIMTDFIFLGSKITADGDCSHELIRYLFLEEKL